MMPPGVRDLDCGVENSGWRRGLRTSLLERFAEVRTIERESGRLGVGVGSGGKSCWGKPGGSPPLVPPKSNELLNRRGVGGPWPYLLRFRTEASGGSARRAALKTRWNSSSNFW